MRTSRFVLWALCVGGALACSGGTPTNFAGTYTVTVVDGSNDCNFANWTPGSSNGNIPVTITQQGSTGQFAVGGLAGLFLLGGLGSSSFASTISGDTMTATYLGTKQLTQATCLYSINANLSVTLTNSTNLNGTLTYSAKTNLDPTCGSLNTCSQQQTIVGVKN